MEKTRLQITGWLVFFRMAAGFTALLFTIILLVRHRYGMEWLAFRTIAGLGIAALTIYILYTFRTLLNERYNFHGADTIIPVLAWFALIAEGIDKGTEFIQMMDPDLRGIFAAVRIIFILIPFGILYIMYSLKMLKLGDRGSRLLQFYSYTLMGIGICFVSVILLPFALLAGLAMDVSLGLIFLTAVEDTEFV